DRAWAKSLPSSPPHRDALMRRPEFVSYRQSLQPQLIESVEFAGVVPVGVTRSEPSSEADVECAAIWVARMADDELVASLRDAAQMIRLEDSAESLSLVFVAGFPSSIRRAPCSLGTASDQACPRRRREALL